MKKRERIVGYDCIRIIAILMVVVIHCNVNFLSSNSGSAQWVFIMELTSVCLVAVPLFFMVSGALLLDCEQVISARENLIERIPKQAVPFVIWSCIYVTARILLGKIDFSVSSYLSLLYEPAWYQFWFMYTLLAIYLLLPLIQLLILNANKRQLEYLLIIWFAFSVMVPYLGEFIPGFKISEHVDLILCEGFLGYFILGHYLHRYQIKIKQSVCALLLAAGCVYTGIIAYCEFYTAQAVGSDYAGYGYQSYLQPGVVIAVSGAFLLCANINMETYTRTRQIIIKLSQITIGVYYIHMLVVTVLEEIGLSGYSIPNLFLKIILSWLLSVAGAYVISLIPCGRFLLLGLRRNNFIRKVRKTHDF